MCVVHRHPAQTAEWLSTVTLSRLILSPVVNCKINGDRRGTKEMHNGGCKTGSQK